MRGDAYITVPEHPVIERNSGGQLAKVTWLSGKSETYMGALRTRKVGWRHTTGAGMDHAGT